MAYIILGIPEVRAQSQELKELRVKLELLFMCSVKNNTTPNIKEYFEDTNDKTLQREWNRAIVSSKEQMKNSLKSGEESIKGALTRYELSCRLLDDLYSLPIELQSALYK